MKNVASLVVVVLFLSLGWVLLAQSSSGERVLEFETMIGVSGPFLGTANPIGGVSGAGAPWAIARGRGELGSDGRLEVEVQGLVLAAGPLAGTNPVANFRAIVSCRSIDGLGNPSIVILSTDLFPATTTGDANIEATVVLPNSCFAPLILVTSPTGRWLAITGR